MGEILPPKPVKLFIGMLSPDAALFDACADMVSSAYGPIDYQSRIIPWAYSDYYSAEMGDGILRKFIFFERLIDPAELSSVKNNTNRIEQGFARHTGERQQRRINLDPGYVSEAKVVLATTKDYAHRIYLNHGIYAEVTLRYAHHHRSFTPFDYTYPDYSSETYTSMFNAARDLLKTLLKSTRE